MAEHKDEGAKMSKEQAGSWIVRRSKESPSSEKVVRCSTKEAALLTAGAAVAAAGGGAVRLVDENGNEWKFNISSGD